MKRILFVMLMLAAFPAHAETIRVGVDGMVCAFCVKGVEDGLMKEPQTEKVTVDLDKALVTIQTKPGTTLSDAQIKAVIDYQDYDVTSITRDGKA